MIYIFFVLIIYLLEFLGLRGQVLQDKVPILRAVPKRRLRPYRRARRSGKVSQKCLQKIFEKK